MNYGKKRFAEHANLADSSFINVEKLGFRLPAGAIPQTRPGDRSQNDAAALNIGGYGSGQPGMTVSNFRITSKGVGQNDSSVRYLQSYYGKEY